VTAPRPGARICIEDLTADTLRDLFSLPGGCELSTCLYWEHPDHVKDPAADRGAMKADWFRRVQAEFGCCGKLARAEGVPVAFAQFAPARCFPCAVTYDCGPPGDDAVFISCLFVAEEWRGRGIGAALVRAVLEDLQGRGLPAVETYARKESDKNCSGPLEFWVAWGFVIHREDPGFALVRKELVSP
jgi:GNAT superfamily N-acetyltransferase